MRILNLMKRLGYTINPSGMCYGIAFMAIQAIIRNDISTYQQRLKFINGYDTKLEIFHVEFYTGSPDAQHITESILTAKLENSNSLMKQGHIQGLFLIVIIRVTQ